MSIFHWLSSYENFKNAPLPWGWGRGAALCEELGGIKHNAGDEQIFVIMPEAWLHAAAEPF